MGCSSSKSDAGTDADPPVPAQVRRRLSVGQVDIPKATEAPPPTEVPTKADLEESQESVQSSEEAATRELLAHDAAAKKGLEAQAPEKSSEAGARELPEIYDKADFNKRLGAQQGKRVRRYSIGSTTDQGRTSFANKTTELMRNNMDVAKDGLGFTCRKGLKPESPNQDSWSVLEVHDDYSIYGVYDGHGQKGHDVSNYVKDIMPQLIVGDKRFRTKEMEAMMIDIFQQTQELISTASRNKTLSAQMSGTTATVTIHDHSTKKLTIAHVADSTAVLASYKDNTRKELTARQLTRDHKPDLPDERARIEKAGGRVVFDGYCNHRVYAKNARYPGLNMSRCLGDLLGHQDAGCSCVPEVLELSITPEDHMLLLCSDGVWEFIEPQQAVDLVKGYGRDTAMQAADALAQEAWNRWIKEEGGTVVDDITVVIVYLQSGKE